MNMRRPLVIENPLLIVLFTLATIAIYAFVLWVLLAVARSQIKKFETRHDVAPAGGRAACEPWLRVDGALLPPEVAAGATAESQAPP